MLVLSGIGRMNLNVLVQTTTLNQHNVSLFQKDLSANSFQVDL